MHACIKECDVVDTKKEVVFVPITSMKLVNRLFVFVKPGSVITPVKV